MRRQLGSKFFPTHLHHLALFEVEIVFCYLINALWSTSGMGYHLPRHFSYLLLMPGYMCCWQSCSCCQREESQQVCQPWPSIPLYASGHRIIECFWPKDIGLCEGTREESKEGNGQRKGHQSSFSMPLCGNTEG